MPDRVRLQDVASLAGVSLSAASMALRHSRRGVSSATARRVEAAAEKLGYVPDPAARALAMQSADGRQPFRGTVAFLVNGGSPASRSILDHHMSDKPGLVNLRYLLCEQGYSMDGYLLPDSAAGAAALARTIRARGTVGLMVDFLNWHYPWDFSWADYPVVALSPHPLDEPLSCVITHSVQDILLSVKTCLDRGYMRMGLLTACWFPDWEMGFFYASRELGGTLGRHSLAMNSWDSKRFLSWFRKHRPDLILANEDSKLLDCLQAEGVQVPGEVGYCCLDVPDNRLDISGIRQSREELEHQGVALLHQQIIRGGNATRPIRVEIPGYWNEGQTVRHKV